MKQQLNFLEILMISIGTIIGTGIFLIPGIVANLIGPGSILLWGLIALLSLPMGFSFAELSKNFSKSGGPILFVKSAFGDFFGFIAGWTSWIISAVTISSLAIAVSFYFSFFIEMVFFQKILLSCFIIFLFTFVNYFGVKTGARAQIFLTLMTLVILSFFIIFGIPEVSVENFFPLFPLGLGFLGLSLALILEPFIGWETLTIIAEEVRNPRKYIPKAIIITTVLVAVFYVSIIFISLGSTSWQIIAASSTPLLSVMENLSSKFVFLTAVAIILVSVACLNSWVLTTSRLPYAMAKEKMFLDSFKNLSKYNTPTRALVLQALIAMFIVFLGYQNSILLILSNAFVLYVLCFLSLIKLSNKRLFPIISIIASIILFTQIGFSAIVTGLIVIFLGIPVYSLIKLTNDRKFTESFYNRISFVFDFLFPLWYKNESKEVLRNAELKDDQVILDYGCGSGFTTLEIAKAVNAKIVAADIARKPMEKAIKRIEKMGKDVIFVKLTKATPFEKETFDRIICVAAIDHFVKPEKELKQLYRVLKKNGIASFLAFGKSLGIPPEKFLRHDKNVKNVFRRAGFKSVIVNRKKRLGSEYIFIKAKK